MSSRPSFRPRPLDIHKKLPIVKSVKDFEDFEDVPPTASTRNSQVLRLAAADTDNEVHPLAYVLNGQTNVHHIPSKKVASEIPTPEFVVVDTYERDYSSTFSQPTSYLRGRGARAEIGEFVEYDLDNDDEDWLQEFNTEKTILTSEKFESLLFKLEVLDHKTRERAGVITPTLGSPIPVLLQFDAAVEALQAQTIQYSAFQSIYNYWKEKRERWRKPILRRLQPPPPVNDTNPYNVFRPREKAHRLHTRRMQRRENNVQSFEKLRQVRRNLDQAKAMLEALIKREEKKRDVMEIEVSVQRIQIKYKNDSEFIEDSLALPGFTSFPCKFGSSEEEFMDSDDFTSHRPHSRPVMACNSPFTESQLMPSARNSMRQQDSRLQHGFHGWLQKIDPSEPLMLFTKPIDPETLASAGITPPSNSSTRDNASPPSYKIRGRIGRGGRIIFDRCNPLMHTPSDYGSSFFSPLQRTPAHFI